MTKGTPRHSLFQSPVLETGTIDRSLEVYSELPRITLVTKTSKLHTNTRLTSHTCSVTISN